MPSNLEKRPTPPLPKRSIGFFGQVGSSIITKLTVFFIVCSAVSIVSVGVTAYRSAASPLERLTRSSGEVMVESFSRDNIFDIHKRDLIGLQYKLDNRTLADQIDWILDALVLDKDFNLLAKKRSKAEISRSGANPNPESSINLTRQWGHLRGARDLTIKEAGATLTISSPVIYADGADPIGYVVFVFSQAPSETMKANLFEKISKILLFAVLAIAILIAFFSYRWLRPVVDVTKAFDAMDRGETNWPIRMKEGNDELARLLRAAASHQGMMQRIARFTHPACQKILNGDITENTRLQKANCVFVDVVGSTQRSNIYNDNPEQHVGDLNEFIDLLEAWTGDFGATPLTYLGDGIFLGFGILGDEPVTPQNSRRALMAVVGAQVIFHHYAYIMREFRGQHPLICRIGVSTGAVLVGRVGRSLTAMGPPANYAARLQSECEPGKVACDKHILLNASPPLEEGEVVPEEETVRDRDDTRHSYASLTAIRKTKSKGFGGRQLPVYHINGLRSPEANDELVSLLRAFRLRTDIVQILEKGLSPSEVEKAREQWTMRLDEKPLRLPDVPKSWFIPDDEGQWPKSPNGDNAQ